MANNDKKRTSTTSNRTANAGMKRSNGTDGSSRKSGSTKARASKTSRDER
jgi:hypothetical protein